MQVNRVILYRNSLLRAKAQLYINNVLRYELLRLSITYRAIHPLVRQVLKMRIMEVPLAGRLLLWLTTASRWSQLEPKYASKLSERLEE